MKVQPAAVSPEPMVALNEALILGAIRQHELTEIADNLNARLRAEIADRQLAEATVRLSEVRYRRLFEAAQDGILLLDPATRKITDANPAMTSLLGRPFEELIGKELFEIGLLKDQAASRRLFRHLKKHHEVRYGDLPLGGGLREVEVVANLYQEDCRTVIHCNVRDITERKKAVVAQRGLDVMTVSNIKLNQEIIRRQAVEEALQQTEREQARLLEQSRRLQGQLRDMSHQILQAQEDERKRISRELHDVIGQTLLGINVHVSALAQASPGIPPELRQKIDDTHRLVEESVEIVHKFARELRPAMLDDLGLIPALHSYLKGFLEETGIRTSLKAFAGIEEFPGTIRTALYRVAQEALTNVSRHARASHVAVSIENRGGFICMEITDDGQGFQVDAEACTGNPNCLGLRGMRERIEMIGGSFRIDSAPGQPTTIYADIPYFPADPVELSPAEADAKRLMPVSPITVLLVEDHMIVREGFRALLESEADIQVLGEADDGRQAVKLARSLMPDVVVMDIGMPLLNGLEATRQILAEAPATKVLILSAHSDDAYIKHVMTLGASGYLVKQTAARILPGAIRKVHQGELCYSPAISKRLRQWRLTALERKASTVKSDSILLTSREREVLQLIAEGKLNKETAFELGISIKTVEKHRQNLMEKLSIHDTASLTRYAIANGIIECSVQLTIL